MGDIVETIVKLDSFSMFLDAVKVADLVGLLKGPGPFTVFAPTDVAFKNLPAGTVEELLNDIPKLKTVLTYHFVSGRILAVDVSNLKQLKTVQGQDLTIDASRWHLHRSVKVNDANILQANVVADNGVVHIIDTVLFPPTVNVAVPLSYKVQDYMVKAVHTIPASSTVAEAARTMAADADHEGYLIVYDVGKPLGIVTENDIVNRLVAQTLDPSKTTVAAIMSSPLISVKPDEDLLEAATVMAEHKVKKLVVMANGVVSGIITSYDISQSCGRYVDRTFKDIIRWTSPLTY